MGLPSHSTTVGGTLVVGADFRERRGVFFAQTFGRHEGYLCIARIKLGNKSFNETFFKYPEDLDSTLDYIEESAPQYNLYFCAQLLTRQQRRKEYVEKVAQVWADLDPCHPKKLLIPPTIAWESSPNRYQAIWRLEEAIDGYDAELLSHRIAYHHRMDGVDQSGWDRTQLLRIPFTTNFKYGPPYPEGKIIEARKGHYRVEDFSVYEPIPGEVSLNGRSMPRGGPSGAEIIAANRGRIPDFVVRLFNEEPDETRKEGWSGPLWALIKECIERNLTLEETFAIARDAACNKYERDGRPAEALWRDIYKAHAQETAHTQAILAATPKPSELLDPNYKQPDSFVERYIAWAKEQTDAPAVYHQAGAFMVLSTALCDKIVLPTMDRPKGDTLNLWFCLIADTTATRKTTSLNMATDLLEEIVPDAIATNEATLEGLWTVMATRAGKASIFKRDEFSGMLDMATKKEYYSGLLEQLTLLYDGTSITRQLAKSTIKVKDPRLIMFVGGARKKIFDIINEGHISSGFLPRFVFFTGITDIDNLRPMGPPTPRTTELRDNLVDELRNVVYKYSAVEQQRIGTVVRAAGPKVWKAELTEDAWERYRLLDKTMLKDAHAAGDDELLMPMYQRLAKSILKSSVLLAACRDDNPTDGKIVVTVEDIEHAISYGVSWRESAIEVLSAAGASPYESQLKRVVQYIYAKQAHGANRKAVMNTFKLQAFEGKQLLDTLMSRGIIRESHAGKEVLYFPTGV